MDPRYYAQGSSSQYSAQYQDGAGPSQQVIPVEAQAVTHYIRALYENPSHQVAPPTQAPAFFAKAQKDIMEAKHKLEQMLLINQQQAEIAAATQTIPAPSNPTQRLTDHGIQYQQAYHQANYRGINNTMQYQQPAWTNTVGGGWVNHQQMYVQPAQHAYTAHFSPEIEMVDMPPVRMHGTTQRSHEQQSSLPRQQAGLAAQPGDSHQLQERAVAISSAPSGSSRTDPQSQAVSGHQHAGASTTQAQQLRHPQPQHHSRRNTLQPTQSTSHSNPPQHKPTPDQLAAAQKQLQLLQHLEQQHQRSQPERPTLSDSQHQLSAQQQHSQQQARQQLIQPKPVAKSMPAAEVPVNTQSVSSTPIEPAGSPKPDVVPLGPSIHPTPRAAPPQKEPETPTVTVPTPAPASRSPAKITRAGRGFALQDLRSERRHSSRGSLSQSTSSKPQTRDPREANPEKNVTDTSIDSINQAVAPNHGTESSSVGDNIGLGGPAGMVTVSVPPSDDNIGAENLWVSSDEIMTLHTSPDTPSASILPPSGSTRIAGPVVASQATSPPAVVSTVDSSLSGPAEVRTTSSSDASVPALNMPSTSTISVSPAMSAASASSQMRVSTTQGASGESSTPTAAQPGATSSTAPVGTTRVTPTKATPMKVMLEFLHENGIDCVEIVRRAAQAAGASEDLALLQKPSPGMGGGNTPVIPLFAPNQPLEIWTHALRVPKALGDLIVKYIWEISWEKANQAGLKVPREAAKGPARASGSNGMVQGNGGHQAGNNTIGTAAIGTVGKSATPPGEPETGLTPRPIGLLASQPAQSTQHIHSTQNKPPHPSQQAQLVPPVQPVQLAQVHQVHSRSQTHTPTPNTSSGPSQAPSVNSTHLPTTQGAPSGQMPPNPPNHQYVLTQQYPPQGYYNMPPVQGYPHQGSDPAPAQLHYYAPYPAVHPPPLQQYPLQHPAQYYSQAQTHPYAPPHPQGHRQSQAPKAAPTQPAAAEQTKESKVAVRPSKTGNTAALDYIRSLGLTPELEELPAKGKGSGSEAGSEMNKTKAKGKGKAKAVTVEDVVQSSTAQSGTPVDKGKATAQPLAEAVNGVVTDAVTPVMGDEVGQAVKSAPTPEIPQVLVNVSIPSPLLVPSIAVLQEPQTPSTSASSFSVQLPEPAPPVPVSPPVLAPTPTVLQEVVPTPASPSTPVLAEIPAPGPVPLSPPISPPVSAPASVSAPAPAFVSAPTPAPATLTPAQSPGPSSATGPTLGIIAPSPVRAFAPAAIMDHSSNRVSPTTSPAAPPPIASSSTLTSNIQKPHSEHLPLKRKRKVTDPASSASPSTPTAQDPTMSWAAMYAQAANAMHSAPVIKRPRTTEPSTASHSVPRKPSENAASGSRPVAKPAKPMPLFRPATPPIDTENPLRSPVRTGKRRLIMEVVIPLRKVKLKAAVPPVKSMIDLTLGADDDDDEDEDEPIESEETEEDRTEKEQDLKLLRRRLREHACKWRECAGPAVLSSAELLGVHLNKKHFYRRSSTGSFVCRWGSCRTSFRRAKDLWEHISEEHIVHPLYCPYQDCDRTVADRYQLLVHVKRAHRGKSDSELRPLARPEECPPEQEVIRPSAFPPGVPYFRIMGMMLRYNVQPARISATRHARIGPVILRNISATTSYASPTRTATPYMPQEPGMSAGANAMSVFESPVPTRTFVRLGTLPPDVLGEELQRETAGASASKPNPSPTRSHITVHSDDETPESEVRESGGSVSRARGGVFARGFSRGHGIASRGRPHTSQASGSSRGSVKGPRLQVVVELPSPRKRNRG